MQFRGGTAPLKNRSNSRSSISSGATSPSVESIRPVTASGENNEITDINLALRFNRQVTVSEDDEFDISTDFDAVGSPALDTARYTDDSQDPDSTQQYIENGLRGMLQQTPDETKYAKRPDGRGTDGTGRTDSRRVKPIAEATTAARERPSSTKGYSASKLSEPRAMSANNMLSQISAAYGTKARFSTSTKPAKRPPPALSGSLVNSPYIVRSSSAKTARTNPPKLEAKPRKLSAFLGDMSPPLEAEAKVVRPGPVKLNSSAATLLATNSRATRHPSVIIKSFAAEPMETTDPGSALQARVSVTVKEALVVAASLNGPLETTAPRIEPTRSSESEESGSIRRAARRQATAAGTLHMSASVGTMSTSADKSTRPKSRKLYLGVDQDEDSISIDDATLRRSVSAYELIVLDQELKRPPSRQKIAATHLFDHQEPEIAAPIDKPELQPRARSANIVPTRGFTTSDTLRRDTMSAMHDPISDGFEELGDTSLPSPFKTIVTNYEIARPEGAKRRKSSSPRNLDLFNNTPDPFGVSVLESPTMSTATRRIRKNSSVYLSYADPVSSSNHSASSAVDDTPDLVEMERRSRDLADSSPLTVASLNWEDNESVSEESLLSETSSYNDQNGLLESSLGEDFLSLFAPN